MASDSLILGDILGHPYSYCSSCYLQNQLCNSKLWGKLCGHISLLHEKLWVFMMPNSSSLVALKFRANYRATSDGKVGIRTSLSLRCSTEFMLKVMLRFCLILPLLFSNDSLVQDNYFTEMHSTNWYGDNKTKVEHQETLGQLRSITPNMVNQFPSQSPLLFWHV